MAVKNEKIVVSQVPASLVDSYVSSDFACKQAELEKSTTRKMLLAAVPESLLAVSSLTLVLEGTQFQIVVSKSAPVITVKSDEETKKLLLRSLTFDLFVRLANFTVSDLRQHLTKEDFDAVVECSDGVRRFNVQPKVGG